MVLVVCLFTRLFSTLTFETHTQSIFETQSIPVETWNMINLLVLLTYLSPFGHYEVSGESVYQCHDAYSCALTTMSDTTTSESNIECYGYQSCTQATKIESTLNAAIYCYGGYSCSNATLIQHINEIYFNHIYCLGTYSCAFVESIYNEYGHMYCECGLSCAE